MKRTRMLVLRSSMLHVAGSGLVVATRGLLRWIAPDRAAYKPNTLIMFAWRARNLSQKTLRSLPVPPRAWSRAAKRS